MVSRFKLSERTFGQLPLPQTPPLAAIAQNPADAIPGSVGGTQLHDLLDGTDPQDAATVAQVPGFGGDLLTGDSSTFNGGIGNWTASAPGTIADDTDPDFAWPFAGQHNALITPNSGGGATCAVPGTFLTGVRYAALFVVQNEGIADSILLGFGDGGDSGGTTVAAAALYGAYVVYWTPSADRTSVTASVSSAGTEIIRLVRFAAVRADVLEDTILALARFPTADPDVAQDPGVTLIGSDLGPAQGVKVRFQGDQAGLIGRFGNAWVFVLDDDTGRVYVKAAGGATPADLSAVGGFLVEVGPDGVGIRVIEEDSGTLQIFPTGNDAKLRDNPGTGVWKTMGTRGTFDLQNIADVHVHQRDRFDADGATDDFVLTDEPLVDSEIVALNGVVQVPTDDYTVTGTTLHFVAMPTLADIVLASYAKAVP